MWSALSASPCMLVSQGAAVPSCRSAHHSARRTHVWAHTPSTHPNDIGDIARDVRWASQTQDSSTRSAAQRAWIAPLGRKGTIAGVHHASCCSGHSLQSAAHPAHSTHCRCSRPGLLHADAVDRARLVAGAGAAILPASGLPRLAARLAADEAACMALACCSCCCCWATVAAWAA